MNKNRVTLAGIGSALVIAALTVLAIIAAPGVDIKLKNPLPEIISDDTTSIEITTPTIITQTEPINLNCLSRTVGLVTITGTREHKSILSLNKTYRVDRLTLSTSVDVDTCVEGRIERKTTITKNDKTVEITVPSDAIIMNRPRVNTDTSTLHYEKGLAGKITDSAPWVSDDDPMIAAAYQFAQHIIVSSDCTESAWSAVRRAITESLVEETAKTTDATSVTVNFDGTPDFSIDKINDRPDIKFYAGPVSCG